MDGKRELLRHTLATLAYRGAKVIRDAPVGFAGTRACPTCRSAIEVLSHMSDLLDWALTAARSEPAWHESVPQDWNREVDRFFAAILALDHRLASEDPLACLAERIFQGPIADALTHIGQLATLRRLAGAPISGENYFVADMVVGCVGREQTKAKFEFD